MSICQSAILSDQNLPTLNQIESHVKSLGYDLTFIEKPSLRDIDGPVVANFEGSEVSFHASYGYVRNYEQVPTEFAAVGDRILEIVTKGGDFRSGLFANVFLRSFCEIGSAGWWYVENAEFFQLPETTAEYFDEQIQAYRDHVARRGLEASPNKPEATRGFFSRLFAKKD